MRKGLTLTVLLGGLLTATSCLKPPVLTADNGPQAEPSEVQRAILDAWNGADFTSIRQNEFLYIEQDQKIATLESRVVYKEASDVKERVVDEAKDTVTYRFEIQSQSMENGSFKPITVLEDEITVPRTPSTASQSPQAPKQKAAFPASLEALQKSMASGSVGLYSSPARNHFLGLLTINSMLLACVKGENWDVTCHNLQVSEGSRPPPVGVASQPNCGGIPNCLIRYKKISFDLVVNLKKSDSASSSTEKVNYELVLSEDVPYLSRLLEFCYQGMVPTQNQKVLVKICNKVGNFLPGDPH